MIRVLPETQAGEDGIAAINLAVTVAALFRLVKDGQREESVGCIGRWLRREVAEQFFAVVNLLIPVAVKSEPCVV